MHIILGGPKEFTNWNVQNLKKNGTYTVKTTATTDRNLSIVRRNENCIFLNLALVSSDADHN